MATLDQHPSTSIIRLLNIGESGSGKTGALASLVAAGYTLYLLDYDNGLDILANAIRESYKSDAEGLKSALQRVHYAILRDEIVTKLGVPSVKAATAYKKAATVLTEWDVSALGPSDILVLDSLTTFSEAAFRQALSVGGRLNQRPQLQDYGWVADSVKLFTEMLTDDSMHCNLIVNTHIRYFSGDEDNQTQPRGLPNAVGQQIPATISRYFNTVVLSKTKGSGPTAKRIISTRPQGVIEVKTSNPFGVKPEYGIEDGMAQLFYDILGSKPTTAPRPPAPTVQTTTNPTET